MKLFGFDFSIAKPAMCFYDTETKKMEFYTWPSKIEKKGEAILKQYNINLINRHLDPVSQKELSISEITKIHTKRSTELAKLITETVKELVGDTPKEDVHIATEGLSFGSQGNRTLDLSGYKFVLLSELYREGFTNLYTYGPVTGKSTAKNARGLGKKKFEYSKTFMIESIAYTDPTKHVFIKALCENDQALHKGQDTYVTTVDDMVDSYWILRTMCEKDLNISDLY